MRASFTIKLRRFLASRSGGAAVELAVVFPFLLLLVAGVVDFGRVFYTSVAVANAARAGAEYGSRNFEAPTDTAGMRQFAQQDGNEVGTLAISARYYCRCGATTSNPPCAACNGGAAPDVFVEVTASRTVDFLLPYPGLPSSFAVSRKATFRTQ
jgi:Flp pilus assembly protein TadG